VVSGWIGVPQTVSSVLAVALVTLAVTGKAGYVLIAALLMACALPFALTIPDARLPATDRPPFAVREFGRSFWLSPRQHPDFAWAWLSRFAVNLGNAIAVLYLLYFLRDRVHYSHLFPGQTAENGLLILLLIYTAAVVITAVAGGAISDRSGRRKLPVTVAGLVMAVLAVMLALWPRWPVAVTSAAITGLGFGVYLSVDQALITQVLPSARARAKDLGIIASTCAGAQVLAPAIAAPLVTPTRRVPSALPIVSRHHRARLSVRMEDPLSAVTFSGPRASPQGYHQPLALPVTHNAITQAQHANRHLGCDARRAPPARRRARPGCDRHGGCGGCGS